MCNYNSLLYITTVNVYCVTIVGNNAIFVAKVLSRNEARTSGDFSKQRDQIVQGLKRNSSIAAYNAIKENAGVIDNRNDFY